MVSNFQILKYLFPAITILDVEIDGNGKIINWNAAIGAQPAEAQINNARPLVQAAFDKEINNVPILGQIRELESRQHRAVREALLTGDKTRIQDLENQIAELRAKLI